jgi:glycosyltransferase involved in cell wall biosynthesis
MPVPDPTPGRSRRILLVLGTSTGGIGRHVVTLVDGLVERGHQVTVCAPDATADVFEFGRRGARVVVAPVGSLRPRAVIRVRGVLRRLGDTADVTHAHGARATALCALSGLHPLVSTWHNAPVGGRLGSRIHAGVERLAARGADVTLAASADLARRARHAGAARVHAVPVSAPPLGPPRRRPATVRADLGIGTRPLVLAVARLSRQKRLDVLVQAAQAWREQAEGPVVVVAGDGPERGRLVAAATRAGAPVRFVGRRDDVADLLAAADVVALSSAWEARPLVAQEALRAGVPLVATAVGGVEELVGDAALLVAPGDADALRRAIERVLGDPALRASLADRGRRRSAQWPSVHDMLDVCESAYLEASIAAG